MSCSPRQWFICGVISDRIVVAAGWGGSATADLDDLCSFDGNAWTEPQTMSLDENQAIENQRPTSAEGAAPGRTWTSVRISQATAVVANNTIFVLGTTHSAHTVRHSTHAANCARHSGQLTRVCTPAITTRARRRLDRSTRFALSTHSPSLSSVLAVSSCARLAGGLSAGTGPSNRAFALQLDPSRPAATAASDSGAPLAAILLPVVAAVVLALFVCVLWHIRSHRDRRRKHAQAQAQPPPPECAGMVVVRGAPSGLAGGVPVAVPVLPAATAPVSSVRLHFEGAEEGAPHSSLECASDDADCAPPPSYSEHDAAASLLMGHSGPGPMLDSDSAARVVYPVPIYNGGSFACVASMSAATPPPAYPSDDARRGWTADR